MGDEKAKPDRKPKLVGKISVAEAKEKAQCRFCLQSTVTLVQEMGGVKLDFGAEHAHVVCLKHAIANQPLNRMNYLIEHGLIRPSIAAEKLKAYKKGICSVCQGPVLPGHKVTACGLGHEICPRHGPPTV